MVVKSYNFIVLLKKIDNYSCYTCNILSCLYLYECLKNGYIHFEIA